MDEGARLGLIGGLGVGAAVYYYRSLTGAFREHDRTLDLVMIHAESRHVHEYVEADDREGLATYLAGFIQRLKDAGANSAIIPAVTPHFCLRELRDKSPLPVLDIFAPLNEEIAARKIRRAVIFGTRFVMASAIYGQLKDVEIIPMRSDETDYVHETYVELVRLGTSSDGQYEGLSNLVQALYRRESLDAIILAGTDFTSVFQPDNTHFSHMDCAALHIRAIVKAAVES